MSDFIGIDVQGLPELNKLLQDLPEAARDQVVEDVGTYLVNVLKAYPSKKYVTRAAAFPGVYATSPTGKRIPGYFSWAQFKKVMALVGEGKVPYSRTQTLSKGWKKIGAGTNMLIANETSYGNYVMGDGQSRHMAAIGWKTIADIVKERNDRIMEIAEAAAKKAVKKFGG